MADETNTSNEATEDKYDKVTQDVTKDSTEAAEQANELAANQLAEAQKTADGNENAPDGIAQSYAGADKANPDTQGSDPALDTANANLNVQAALASQNATAHPVPEATTGAATQDGDKNQGDVGSTATAKSLPPEVSGDDGSKKKRRADSRIAEDAEIFVVALDKEMMSGDDFDLLDRNARGITSGGGLSSWPSVARTAAEAFIADKAKGGGNVRISSEVRKDGADTLVFVVGVKQDDSLSDDV